jgi:photosystem II stability/assembly factor-like uncharacterized protein
MKNVLCLLLISLIFIGCGGKRATEMVWEFQNPNINENIRSISFGDGNHGWAVTESGTLLSTEDAGKTWVSTKISDKKLIAVAAIDDKTFWVAGENGALYASMEGSRSVADRSLDEDVDFVDMAFWDGDNGAIIGNRFDERDSVTYGTVFKTDNGGQNWSEVYVAMDSVTCLFILGKQLGWIGTTGHVWTTNDAGANWEDNYLGSAISINDMHYDEFNSGWLAGDSGTYYTSQDGGWSWDDRGGQFPAVNLYDILFIDRFSGFIVGQGGMIMMSIDGGDTWQFDQNMTSNTLHDITNDGNKLWICGDSGIIIFVH